MWNKNRASQFGRPFIRYLENYFGLVLVPEGELVLLVLSVDVLFLCLRWCFFVVVVVVEEVL